MKCIVCGNNLKFLRKREILFDKNKQKDLMVCPNCGLVSISPLYTKKELVWMYKDYHKKEDVGSSSYPNYLEESKSKEKTFKKRFESILKILKNKKIKSILDVGCAEGIFLGLAKKMQFKNLYGLDIRKNAVNETAKIVGRKNVLLGEIGAAKKFKKRLTLVTLWDVIEHTANPFDLIKKINVLQDKGGVVALTTPDKSSIAARITGKSWIGWKGYREHQYFFDKVSLENLLSFGGYRILYAKHCGFYYSLDYILKRAKNYPFFPVKLFLKLFKFVKADKKIVYFNPLDILFVIAIKSKDINSKAVFNKRP